MIEKHFADTQVAMPTNHFLALQLAVLSALGATACNNEQRCQSGESIVDGSGKPTGFIRCADGAINRSTSPTLSPTVMGSCTLTQPQLSSDECRSDAACGDKQRCMQIAGFEQAACYCTTFCSDDNDCSPGQACMATQVSPQGTQLAWCADAECRSNKDCKSGECGVATFHNGCFMTIKLACRTDEDTCRGNAECPPVPEMSTDYCTPDFNNEEPGEAWACRSTQTCNIGRPFLVNEHERVAPFTARADWCESTNVSAFSRHDSTLSDDERQILGSHWAEQAAGEHASVASFARFILHLMGHGAPPDLLAQSARALADEVRHAQHSFALAGVYLEKDIGPDTLALEDAVKSVDRRELIHALVEEACVGETLAVARAMAALHYAGDPEVCKVLEEIVADETRHAALGWRALMWAVGQSTALRSYALECMRDAIAQVREHSWASDKGNARLRWHGLLDGELLRQATSQAIVDILMPAILVMSNQAPTSTLVHADGIFGQSLQPG